MLLDVFVSDSIGSTGQELLVIRYGPESEIPSHHQHRRWRHLATVPPDDKLLGSRSATIVTAVAKDGYAIIS